MMVIGRGHTVYIDNKSIDYNGQTYTTPYKVVVYVDGEQVAKLRDKERGINLPAYLAGLPEEAYLSEFQVAPEVVEEESESSSDEIPVDGIPAEGIPSDI